jgi:hypothetical protein
MLHLNVAADGTVEMPESEAESFVRAGWQRVNAGRPGRNAKQRFEMNGDQPVITVRHASPTAVSCSRLPDRSVSRRLLIDRNLWVRPARSTVHLFGWSRCAGPVFRSKQFRRRAQNITTNAAPAAVEVCALLTPCVG